jgi:hypothetical protein
MLRCFDYAFVMKSRTFMFRALLASVRALAASAVTVLVLLPVGGVSQTASSTGDLPSIETVLQHVRTMAPQERGNDAAFRSRYAFVRTRTTRELDSDGKIKNEKTKESRNNPGPLPGPNAGPAVKRVVYQLPVQPVTAEAPAPATAQQNPPRAFDKNEFVLNDDLIGRFNFRVVGRDRLNGRNAVKLQFAPKSKDLPTRNFKDRFINKAAGTVWIDEGDWLLAKVDLYLTEGVNVAGGLVGAVKKFNYRFDRDRTSDGLWYTTQVDWHLEGRELFSRKILEYEEHRSDIKKVH